MKTLTQEDLKSFQQAILKDYGVKLEDEELYQAAFDLFKFFEELISSDYKNKQKEVEVQKSS